MRAEAAGDFARRVGEHLAGWPWPGPVSRCGVGETGAGEPVEMLLGANVGEPVQPLARAASGGELARAMLAIRLVGPGRPADHGL